MNDLESIKLASNLGKSVVVHNNVVIIGDCVLTKTAFVMVWMWIMTNSRIYANNYHENKDLIRDLEKLNPHLNPPVTEKKSNRKPPYIIICNQVYNHVLETVQDYNSEEKYKTFVRVINDLAD